MRTSVCAPQVDDTFKESKSDHRVTTGESAAAGDRGLELHEFYECLVALGFYRFNPVCSCGTLLQPGTMAGGGCAARVLPVISL